jgi:UDPglucose 6-dehydrogenase
MARVVVVGAGKVGTAVGTGLAGVGHDVAFVDADASRVEQLRDDGWVACTDLELSGVPALVLVCVPTPVRDGIHDLGAIEAAASAFGEALRGTDPAVVHTLVVRSTVPPGTCVSIVQPLIEAVSGHRAGSGFGLASCPEFLREASALDDFSRPASRSSARSTRMRSTRSSRCWPPWAARS